jgi:methyl-accepting chemotaxis protein
MGEGFNVVVGEVRAHATTVTTIASQVRSASSGAQDSVGGGAFGQIAEFFASAITQACGELRSGIERASQTVEQVQSGLAQIADAYQAVDDNHANLFNKAVPTVASGSSVAGGEQA